MFPIPSWYYWKQFFKMLFSPPKVQEDPRFRKSPWLLPEDLERERKEMSRERFR